MAVAPLPVAAQTTWVAVKIGSIPSFNAMEQGILEQDEALGMEPETAGATGADPALCVRDVESLIARGMDLRTF